MHGWRTDFDITLWYNW